MRATDKLDTKAIRDMMTKAELKPWNMKTRRHQFGWDVYYRAEIGEVLIATHLDSETAKFVSKAPLLVWELSKEVDYLRYQLKNKKKKVK